MGPNLIQDAPLGLIIRFLSGGKYFPCPEDLPNFECPLEYMNNGVEKETEALSAQDNPLNLRNVRHTISGSNENQAQGNGGVLDRSWPEAASASGSDVEKGKEKILVDWYSEDDPGNPQNWSTLKKSYVAAQIWLYTFAIYGGSSIYVPSEG